MAPNRVTSLPEWGAVPVGAAMSIFAQPPYPAPPSWNVARWLKPFPTLRPLLIWHSVKHVAAATEIERTDPESAGSQSASYALSSAVILSLE
jgi:hypothetical protein